MLSLSPRHDMFRFNLPKDFLPKEVEEKYSKLFAKESGVIMTPIDYLNESIQSINFPGISDVVIQQPQHGFNEFTKNSNKLNIEPKHDINYQSTANPLEYIDKEFKISFRKNHGFYNYFMLYETMFYQICKPKLKGHQPVFWIEILDENGKILSKIKYIDVLINNIDGLEFGYDKTERSTDTFDVTFKFNNIDFDLNI